MDGDVDDLVALLEEMAAAGETLTPDMLNYADASGRVRRKKRIRCTILGQGFLESCGAGWNGDPSPSSSSIFLPASTSSLACTTSFPLLCFWRKSRLSQGLFLSFWRPLPRHLLFPEEKQSTEYYVYVATQRVRRDFIYSSAFF